MPRANRRPHRRVPRRMKTQRRHAGEEGGGGKAAWPRPNGLGEEPEDNTLEFLRTETVLLKPGDTQCDVGLNYLLTETEFPILLADDMGEIVASTK